jgi:uncharacterized membrane protein YkgB
MDKFLKFLKTEAIGGHIIRISLAGLLLFGGFTKMRLIGEMDFNIFWAVFVAAIETIAAIGLLVHYKRPVYGMIGGALALLSILLRLLFSLSWVKEHVLHSDSFWSAINTFLGIYNNGLFHITLLLGAGIYCLGGSYKNYIRERITQPWPH